MMDKPIADTRFVDVARFRIINLKSLIIAVLI